MKQFSHRRNSAIASSSVKYITENKKDASASSQFSYPRQTGVAGLERGNVDINCWLKVSWAAIVIYIHTYIHTTYTPTNYFHTRLQSASLCIYSSWAGWLPPCVQSQYRGQEGKWTAACRHISSCCSHPKLCLLWTWNECWPALYWSFWSLLLYFYLREKEMLYFIKKRK